MKVKKSPLSWMFAASVIACFAMGTALSQSMDELEKLCANTSLANKAIAKNAGYDLDSICTNLTSNEMIERMEPDLTLIDRATASSEEDISDVVKPISIAGIDPLPDSELKPFGYDLFANSPTTFAPASSIPVSPDYLLGPGDVLDILFYGKDNDSFSLEINREGFVDFPELGPVGLAGLSYGEAKEMLQTRIAFQIVGTKVSISMGSLRSMQIFVLGEAFKPGAYTVSSLSTITNALVNSGGVSDIASLRNIQLKRNGKIIVELDLYDLLMFGDTAQDVRVQAGDVIYIPTVGDVVSISGEVLRPAIYELNGGESMQDLLSLAGGPGPKAYLPSSRLQRISPDGFTTAFDLDLSKSKDKNKVLKGGDHLTVDAVTNFKKSVVTINGAVRHPGDMAWKSGMRVSDIFSSRDKIDADADLDAALLVRELGGGADIEVHLVKIRDILADSASVENIELNSRDIIIIFSRYKDRSSSLKPVIDQLKLQHHLNDIAKIVSVTGAVRFPGEYPLTVKMNVDDLIILAGGLVESTFSKSAEILRIRLSNSERAESVILPVNLKEGLFAALHPADQINFRELPRFRESKFLTLEGEFIFPGVYAFSEKETLMSVIDRAGGFTDQAFLGGSIFLRESLKDRETEEIERLKEQLSFEISSNSLRDATSIIQDSGAQTLAVNNALDALDNIDPIGRLVIPLGEISDFSVKDVLLEHNDRLVVPKFSQEVTIIGEVRRSSSYLFDREFTLNDYIDKSGGLKDSADRSGIYFVRANGEVVKNKGISRLWSFNSDEIAAGDTIIVPPRTDDSTLRGLPLLAEVSKVIYELSLGAAAIRSFQTN